jgi:hypothetical protein
MDKNEVKHRWDDVLAKLKQERDELALKMHLGKKEAAAEWERLEAKWHDVKARHVPPVDDAVDESTVGVGLALELAAEELKKDYEKIRKLLQG